MKSLKANTTMIYYFIEEKRFFQEIPLNIRFLLTIILKKHHLFHFVSVKDNHPVTFYLVKCISPLKEIW